MPSAGARGGSQVIPRPSDVKAGRPAPWSDLADEARHVSAEALVRAVRAAAAPQPVPGGAPPGARPSAVLVPIYDEGDGAMIVLTRRAKHLRMHRGEVSFPGGRREDGETPVQTALREAQEETGLLPADVEIVGELDHLATFTSQSLVVPFVGLLAGRPELVAHEAEVDTILHVPVAELLHPEAFREELWGLPVGYRPLYFFEIVGDTIWGATARILLQLLALATGTHDLVSR